MKPRSGSARKKLNVKEEAGGIHLISAGKEDLLLMRVPRADLSKTFNDLIPSRLSHDGIFLCYR
jgi:hypothetical protein